MRKRNQKFFYSFFFLILMRRILRKQIRLICFPWYIFLLDHLFYWIFWSVSLVLFEWCNKNRNTSTMNNRTSPQLIEKTFILLLMHKTLVDLMSDFVKLYFHLMKNRLKGTNKYHDMRTIVGMTILSDFLCADFMNDWIYDYIIHFVGAWRQHQHECAINKIIFHQNILFSYPSMKR